MKKIQFTFDDSFQDWCRKNGVGGCTCARPGVSQHNPFEHGQSCPVKAAFDAWSKAGEEHWQWLNQSSVEPAPTATATN
jgi:hypothetical protein